MTKSGQFTVETAVVVAFGILMITAIAFVLYIEFGRQMEITNTAQLQAFGNTLINTASKLGYFGETSIITINPLLPSGVINVSVEDNRTLVIWYTQGGVYNEMIFISPVNVAVDFNDFNKGIKNMVIRQKSGYVVICEQNGDRCNNYCDVTFGGENANNSPNDCCTSSCTSCDADGSYSTCPSDSTCYPTCFGHNGCNTEC